MHTCCTQTSLPTPAEPACQAIPYMTACAVMTRRSALHPTVAPMCLMASGGAQQPLSTSRSNLRHAFHDLQLLHCTYRLSAMGARAAHALLGIAYKPQRYIWAFHSHKQGSGSELERPSTLPLCCRPALGPGPHTHLRLLAPEQVSVKEAHVLAAIPVQSTAAARTLVGVVQPSHELHACPSYPAAPWSCFLIAKAGIKGTAWVVVHGACQ
mmetsp:Transcript_34894/g.77562  ORF Transcript_34894/g.77562 Transcript_34894/m.77562 type:complete len:211 (-) Transcript_34894:442-1074(-)